MWRLIYACWLIVWGLLTHLAKLVFAGVWWCLGLIGNFFISPTIMIPTLLVLLVVGGWYYRTHPAAWQMRKYQFRAWAQELRRGPKGLRKQPRVARSQHWIKTDIQHLLVSARQPVAKLILVLVNAGLRLWYLLPWVNHQRKRFEKENKPFLRFKTWRSYVTMGAGFTLFILLLDVYLVGIIKALNRRVFVAFMGPKNEGFNWDTLLIHHLFDFNQFAQSPILAVPLFLLGAWVAWKSAWINWEQFRDYNANESGDDRFATVRELKRQYTLVPDKHLNYAGLGGIPVLHLMKPNLTGWTLGTVMRYRGGPVLQVLNRLKKWAGLSEAVSGSYLIARETINVLVNGTTRSGKGESLVNPTIDLMSRAKVKSSLIVTDPKGELYQSAYKTLRRRGYNVQVLSFQDMDWSMSWNPLALAIDAAKRGYYEKTQTRVNAVAESIYRKSKGGTVKGNEKYWEDTSISLFNAIAMALIDRANEAAETGESDAWDTVTIRNIAKFLTDLGSESVMVDGEGNEVTEPEEGVRYQTKSRLTMYFDELRKVNQLRFSKFREMADINLRTSDFASEETKGNIYSSMLSGVNLFLQDNIARLTSKNSLDLESVGNPRRLQIHFRSNRMKGAENFFAHQTGFVTITAGTSGRGRELVKRTKVVLDRAGYLNFVIQPVLTKRFTIRVDFNSDENNTAVRQVSSVFTGRKQYAKVKDKFSQRKELVAVPVQVAKTSGVELDVNDIVLTYSDQPTALFLVTPPNRSEYNSMSTLLIDQLFNANYEVALSAGRKTTLRMQFILDEFGTSPMIPKMDEKLNIGLGQNIQFMLFVQELAQLKEKYGPEVADNIKAGCSLNMLIKSAKIETTNEYSNLLGKRTIIKRTKSTNILNEANPNINTTNPEQPLMTPTQLKNLQAGEMIVIRGVKGTDNSGRKVTPDPIFASGKTEMPYRYMFLSSEFDQNMTLSDIPVESLHRNLDLRAVALDAQDVFRQVNAWRRQLAAAKGTSGELAHRKNLLAS